MKQGGSLRMDLNSWMFFALAYALSWFFWIPAAWLSAGNSQVGVIILFFVGGFGPTVAGIVMVGRTQDKEHQRDFLQRLFGFKQIGGLWYAFILLVFPLLAVMTVLAYCLIQGSGPALPALDGVADQPQQLLALPLIALQVLLAGPLSEEIGWRGFALDRLQVRWNALGASLILGMLWALWHTPLFFIRGTMYYDWGFGTDLFWFFVIRMVSLSLLMTWVYNNNRNSILSAVLLHFMFNFTFGFFHPAPAELNLYGTLLIAILAAAITAAWGPKTLVRRRGALPL